MLKMYEIQEAFIDLHLAAEAIERAELAGEPEDVIEGLKRELKENFDILEGFAVDKVDNVMRVIKNLKAEVDALAKEKKLMEKKIKSRENNIDFLKNHFDRDWETF